MMQCLILASRPWQERITAGEKKQLRNHHYYDTHLLAVKADGWLAFLVLQESSDLLTARITELLDCVAKSGALFQCSLAKDLITTVGSSSNYVGVLHSITADSQARIRFPSWIDIPDCTRTAKSRHLKRLRSIWQSNLKAGQRRKVIFMSSDSRQGSVSCVSTKKKLTYRQASKGCPGVILGLLVGYLVQSQLMQTVPCRIQMCMWRVICRDLCGISWPMLSLLEHQWPRKVSCLWFSPSACHLRASVPILVGGNDVAEQLISSRRLEYWWLTSQVQTKFAVSSLGAAGHTRGCVPNSDPCLDGAICVGFKISKEASAENGQCQLASVHFVESYSTRLECKVSQYSVRFSQFHKAYE